MATVSGHQTNKTKAPSVAVEEIFVNDHNSILDVRRKYEAEIARKIELERLRKQEEEEKKKADSKTTRLEEQVTDLTGRLDKLTTESKTVTDELSGVKKQLSDARDQLSKKNDRNADLERQVKDSARVYDPMNNLPVEYSGNVFYVYNCYTFTVFEFGNDGASYLYDKACRDSDAQIVRFEKLDTTDLKSPWRLMNKTREYFLTSGSIHYSTGTLATTRNDDRNDKAQQWYVRSYRYGAGGYHIQNVKTNELIHAYSGEIKDGGQKITLTVSSGASKPEIFTPVYVPG